MKYDARFSTKITCRSNYSHPFNWHENSLSMGDSFAMLLVSSTTAEGCQAGIPVVEGDFSPTLKPSTSIISYRIYIGFELVLKCCIDKGCGPQQKPWIHGLQHSWWLRIPGRFHGMWLRDAMSKNPGDTNMGCPAAWTWLLGWLIFPSILRCSER